MSVKIVHAADFHLDSAFGALSAEQARQRRRESRELLTRLCNYVNQNGVDLVLLAGDLFDSDTTYRETLEALARAQRARRDQREVVVGQLPVQQCAHRIVARATVGWPQDLPVCHGRARVTDTDGPLSQRNRWSGSGLLRPARCPAVSGG